MKTLIRTTALCLGLAALGGAPSASAACTALDITLGQIDKPECTIDPEALIRGYELYKARKAEGFRAVEIKSAADIPRPRLPDLISVDINRFDYGAFMDMSVRVKNDGTDDAAESKVTTTVQVSRVSTNQSFPPEVTTADYPALRAGAEHERNVGAFSLPTRGLAYNVSIIVDVDSHGEVYESDERNRFSMTCRILGEGDELIYPTREETEQNLGLCF